MKKTYNVDVDCANCAAKMEDAVKKTPGVQNAALSFMTLKLKVEFEAGRSTGHSGRGGFERAGSWRKTLVGVCEPVYRGYDEHTNG